MILDAFSVYFKFGCCELELRDLLKGTYVNLRYNMYWRVLEIIYFTFIDGTLVDGTYVIEQPILVVVLDVDRMLRHVDPVPFWIKRSVILGNSLPRHYILYCFVYIFYNSVKIGIKQ